MSRKPIPVKSIGGYFNEIPLDIVRSIDPYVTRDYLRARHYAEKIVSSFGLNPDWINYDRVVDDITDVLINNLGLNLDELFNKMNFGEEILSTDLIYDRMLSRTNIFDDLAKLIFPNNHINAQFLSSNLPIGNYLEYIADLFRAAGYKGDTLQDILQQYNTNG